MASPSSQSNPPDTYSLDTNSISTGKIKEGLYGDLIITAVKWMIEAFRHYDSLKLQTKDTLPENGAAMEPSRSCTELQLIKTESSRCAIFC